MTAITRLILKEGDMERSNAMGPITKRIPILEQRFEGHQNTLDIMKTKCPPRLMKTHLSYEFLKRVVEEDKIKIILLMRNPKDILVSYFHLYCSQEGLGKFKGDFHDFFELFKAKRLTYGDPFEHCKSWWEKKDQKNILVVKYEDMVKDCVAVVKQVAEFCEKNIDPQTAQKIVEECHIDNMRKEPLYQLKTKEFSSESFYRKGEVGDWKNYFNEKESKLMDQMSKDYFEPIGLSFQYE